MTNTTDNERKPVRCMRCGGAHPLIQCPRVSAVTFREDGTIEKVEFKVPELGQWTSHGSTTGRIPKQ